MMIEGGYTPKTPATELRAHEVWELSANAAAPGYYLEGYSRAPSPLDELYGWFCLELDTIEEVRRELVVLGFMPEEQEALWLKS